MKNQKVEKFIDGYLKNFKSAKVDKWNYEDGCVLKGAQMMYQVTGEEKYKTFILEYLKKYINEDGTINYYNAEDYNIDNVSTGTVLFFAYDETGEEKYRNAIENIMDQLRKQPRTQEGNFWHKNIYPNQVWLDGLYMGQVFYMMYESRFGGKEHYSDIIKQFKLVRRNMFNDEKQLYYHAYDESRQMYWADKTTGLSQNFWLRSMGWYLLALIECLDAIDQSVYEYYDDLKSLFKEALKGVLKYQDEKTHLFYQVIDRADVKENYLETSGSAMIAYAMLKACRMKAVLAEKYEDNAISIFEALADNKLEEVDGELKLGGICSVAGLGGKEKRDGSLKYYFSEPIVYDDHKGVGPFIMAYSEINRL